MDTQRWSCVMFFDGQVWCSLILMDSYGGRQVPLPPEDTIERLHYSGAGWRSFRERNYSWFQGST
ncbi:hypothetical protein AVEN_59075-1, partial [Araneus ventricosus]